jgi:hypothetical protein
MCESCGADLRVPFNERSTFIALATGGAVWFAAFVVSSALGYPQIAAAVASAAGIVGVAVGADLDLTHRWSEPLKLDQKGHQI